MSFIRTMDDAMKSLVLTKFGPYLGVSDTVKDVVFFPKDVQMRKIAEKRGTDTVEFISLWRTGMKFDWKRNNSPVARKGINLEYTDGGKSSIITAKAVPVEITYDMWIWSRDLNKVMDAAEGYFFWQFSNPKLVLNYLGKYPLEMQMYYDSVVDESPYAQIYEVGTYFVYRFPIKLDGWIFSTFDMKTVLKIFLDIYLREGVEPNYVDTLIDSYIIIPEGSS